MSQPTPPEQFQSAGPRVSVIVPCRNERRYVAAFVAGLLALNAPDGGFEVIVADGQSDDGTRKILDQLETEANGYMSETAAQSASLARDGTEKEAGGPRFRAAGAVLRVIENPRRTTPCGLNAAIRAARGSIIARADAHTEYAPDYLLRCLEVLQQTDADNVGGPARTKAEGYRQRSIAAAYHSPFAVGGARFHDVCYEGWVDTVTYGCWRREAFERFGYFDEELARNQDDEHNLRIVRGGGKIWQSPRINSWYRPRASFATLARQYVQYGYWKVRVIQKHRIPASWRHLVPGMFVLVLALLAVATVMTVLVRPERSAAPRMLLLLTGLYGAAVLAASLVTAARTSWVLLPGITLAFPCYHFGYGWGFLRGTVDFIIRRRSAKPGFDRLTR